MYLHILLSNGTWTLKTLCPDHEKTLQKPRKTIPFSNYVSKSFFGGFLGFDGGFEFLTTKTTVKNKNNHELFSSFLDSLKLF